MNSKKTQTSSDAEKARSKDEKQADKKAWQAANRQNTFDAYQAYLNGNTLKRYATVAKTRLQKDEKAWQNACEQDTPEAYQAYLDGNTVKEYADEAIKRLQTLQQQRYTDNGDGTVTDNKTGLIWLKKANAFGSQDWKTAMQCAANLAHGQCGLSDGSKAGDWRLPTKDEWEAMMDERYNKPALSNAAGTEPWKEGDVFLGVQSSWYWSSTSYKDNTSLAWTMYIDNGGMYSYGKKFTYYVWTVRGGH